jgi:polysaccharide export outer membrane protein
MMIRPYWRLAALLLLLNACVPNRKVVYLQKEDLHKKDVVLDSVVRTHEMVIREYKIQPLDILSIRIESLTAEDFNFISKLYPNVQQTGGGGGGSNQVINGFLVDNLGEIEFPVAGKIKLVGLSLFEASTKLKDAFKSYLKDPVVRVQLLNFRFTVLGEVNAENQVVSNNTRVTLMEAIGMAGGLTDLADRSKVKIVRQKGNQSEVLYLNLLDENLLTSEHYYVHQNDMIIVPALKQRPFRKYWGENVALVVSTLTLVLLVVNLTQ